MRAFRPFLCAAVSVLATTGLPVTAVQAETVDCTPVTSLPAVISTQGIYCLTSNLATAQSSGYAIEIAANNVTLDLNGWKVGGQAAGSGTETVGIFSLSSNVTVKNGIVRGFYEGFVLYGRGAVVRDMLIDQNTFVGIYVDGPGAVIEHNQVIDTGGSTTDTDVSVVGIEADYDGGGARISNNTVSGLTATGAGEEFGITVGAPNSTVRDNVVSDSARPTGGGSSQGITQVQSGITLNNAVSNFDIGITGGTYARNTAIDCTHPYLGGITGAGNTP